MSAISAPRLSFLAVLAATTAPFAALPAKAQEAATISCRDGSGDSRPMPRIVDFSISPASDPAGVRLATPREASVTGGDAERGYLRLALQLDAPVPLGCRMPLTIAAASDSGDPRALAPARQLAAFLDGMEIIADRVEIATHLAGALRFEGNGTDRAEFRIPVQAADGTRAVRHALKLVVGRDYAGALPFTVNVQPLAPFTLVAPAGPARHGTNLVLQARIERPLLPETLDLPLRATLSSAALGGLRQTLRTVDTPALQATGGWDPRFTPLRAEMTLVPGDVAAETSGTVTFAWSGQQQSVPLTVQPFTVCVPRFTVAAVAGGLRVTMANQESRRLPRSCGHPRAPQQPSLRLAPVSATVSGQAVTGLATTSPVQLRTTATTVNANTAAMLRARRDDGGETFTLAAAALPGLTAGLRFGFDARPTAGGASQRFEYTLKPADLSIIAGR
ncbi:MAG: hypothetical protein IPG83_04335 [Novosphingobium sp.]|nr:hypothetical protein [Novosphingobium sp.]